MNRLCKKCDTIKDISEFWKDKTQSGGYHFYCKKCEGAMNKKRRLENADKYKKLAKKYYRKGRIKIIEKQKERYQKKHSEIREQQRVAIRAKRLKVLDYYSQGKLECACCGESEFKFLSIDHIDNNGYQHRKQLDGKNLYGWLIKNDYPSGFQVLCMNCNWGKAMNDNVCPHKK